MVIHSDKTIITKDSDFASRILISPPPPRVIHFRTGNMSMKEFIHWFQKYGTR
ncbi:DUF5615 family PIN-like protein [Dyadobacter fermentans]|uniref:DUF5615 family PIN-like protein n=1 Tax=Dyadobacter fermentans TaxID=94254 RepID=UPI0033A224C6